MVVRSRPGALRRPRRRGAGLPRRELGSARAAARGSALALFGAPETVTGRFHGADASVLDRAAAAADFTTVVLEDPYGAEAALTAICDDFGARITTRWGLGHMPRPGAGTDTASSGDAAGTTAEPGPEPGPGRLRGRRVRTGPASVRVRMLGTPPVWA